MMISEHADPLASPGTPEFGGINVYVYSLARELGRLGWDVDVFTRWDSLSKHQVINVARGVRVIRIRSGKRHFIPRNNIGDGNNIFRHIPEFLDGIIAFRREHRLQYALIHSHYWISGISGHKLSNLFEIPHIATFHTLGHVRHNSTKKFAKQYTDPTFLAFRLAWEQLVTESADLVLMESPEDLQSLVNHYKTANAHMTFVPAGIDLKTFSPISKKRARSRINQPLDRTIILYVGRFDPTKGIATIIEALPEVIKKKAYTPTNLQVILVGKKTGTAKSEFIRIRTLAKKLGVLPYITFVGSVDHSEVKYYFSAADVCAMPSYDESFGQVALEAVTCKCPVVASNIGGLRFIVRPDQNGFLVRPQSPKALATALGRVLEKNAPVREAVKHFAEEIVPLEFSWPKVSEEIEIHYQQVISHYRGKRTIPLL